jgi:hypothetical protein
VYCKPEFVQNVGRPKKSSRNEETVPATHQQQSGSDHPQPGSIDELDDHRPDQLVEAIFDTVPAEAIAEKLLEKATSGNHQASAALLLVIDSISPDLLATSLGEDADKENAAQPGMQRKAEERPRVSSANACAKTFKRRHEMLRKLITRADATQEELRQSVCRHFRQFAIEDPSMIGEVCSVKLALQSEGINHKHSSMLCSHGKYACLMLAWFAISQWNPQNVCSTVFESP